MKKKSVAANALLNMFKQVSNVFFPLITYPYISRTLGASNLGIYSFTDSIVSMVLIFACLGIQTYAVREGARIRNDRDKMIKFSTELFSINFICMVISLITMLICIVLIPRLQRNAVIICCLSINVIANILGRDWLNSVYEDFEYITLRYIFFQVIATILMFILVRSEDDFYKYIMIMIFGNSGGYILNVWYTQRYVPLKITNQLNLKHHIKPMLYLFGVSLAIKIYIQSDIMILGFFKTDSEVGIYTIASKVYTIVKSVLNAIIMVAIPRLSLIIGKDTNEYTKYLKKIKQILYTIVFPCVVGLFMESDNILYLIGGEQFLNGSISLKILCLALIFAVFSCYYANTILVINREDKIFFEATVISAIVNIILNIVLIPFWGIEGAALTTVISEMIVMLKCRPKSYSFQDKELTLDLKKSTVGSIAIVCCCSFCSSFQWGYMIELIISLIMSIFVYGVIEIILKNSIIVESIQILFWKNKKSNK